MPPQAGVKAGAISVRARATTEIKGFYLGAGCIPFPGRAVRAAAVDGVVDATAYGPVAPQPSDGSRGTRQHLFAGAPEANPAQDEFECLRLNVYTPESVVSSSAAATVPVLVWIHGGGWAFKNGNTDYYGKPIVFVSINYRLGFLGFSSSAELAEEAAAHGEDGWANQGLHDQRLALQWVNKHTHLFGDDASRVTIAGESAGAWSVQAHLRSNQPLCQRGLMQSTPSWSILAPDEAQARFNEVVARAGVPASAPGAQKLAALRAASTEDLMAWNSPVTSPAWDAQFSVGLGRSRACAPLDTLRETLPFAPDAVVHTLRWALALPSDPAFAGDVMAAYGVEDAPSDAAAVQAFVAILADACFSAVPWNLAARGIDTEATTYPPVYVYRFDQPDVEEGSELEG
ncbi:putative carboxylesterase [Aspergillus mulundensis]|uniref:Carboxylesterase type B domain-containing protein n=1 Tax=Aspergillus mulundensis TaxID=1810919 RepID=A0A3D8SB69_9EURO|nr:hypothetical protein DSM5745_03935 [Aspergillus mulundensis]RDW83609.1 hypothetical protein DSM5745_03935 [Aspergillus mulundensis]